MSKGLGGGVAWATGAKTAEALLAVVRPWCDRAEVAGSIRRRRPLVNDVDLVLQPNVQSFVPLMDAVRKTADVIVRLGTGHRSWKIQKDGLSVDLYLTSPTTWGMVYLIRTGSKEFNVSLAQRAIAQGMAISYEGFVEQPSGGRLYCREELDVFKTLGVAWTAPEARERSS